MSWRFISFGVWMKDLSPSQFSFLSHWGCLLTQRLSLFVVWVCKGHSLSCPTQTNGKTVHTLNKLHAKFLASHGVPLDPTEYHELVRCLFHLLSLGLYCLWCSYCYSIGLCPTIYSLAYWTALLNIVWYDSWYCCSVFTTTTTTLSLTLPACAIADWACHWSYRQSTFGFCIFLVKQEALFYCLLYCWSRTSYYG